MNAFLKAAAGVGCLVVWAGTAALAAEEGLVAHYRFDEGKGAEAGDASGRGNNAVIHGAKFVRHGQGYALKLDGEDDYLDGGARPDFEGQAAGAFELWVKPREFQGGMVNWSTGTGWKDIRLTLSHNTYAGGEKLMVNASDGQTSRNRQLDPVAKHAWTHMAVSFQGAGLAVYANGRRIHNLSLGFRLKRAGIPLWIGKCQGLGKPFFKGLIDEVRVYNRALSPKEVLVHYKRHAEVMGQDATYFDKPELDTLAMPEPGWVVATARYELMRPVPEGASLHASIGKIGEPGGLALGSTPLSHGSDTLTVKLDTAALPAGEYEVRAIVKTRSGEAFGRAAVAKVSWPGRAKAFKKVKVLNNVVWELLNTSPGKVSGNKQFPLTSPKRRWVYISCTADVPDAGSLRISLDGTAKSDNVIVVNGKAKKTLEAMRPLVAGAHTLRIAARGDCVIEKLVVRSIPELVYARYGSVPHVRECGPYLGKFLDDHVLPHVNTLIVSGGTMKDPFVKEWKARGRRWLVHCGVPKYRQVTKDGVELTRRWNKAGKNEPLTADEAAGFIAKTVGFSHPLADGAIADEFGHSDKYCASYAGAIRKLAASSKFGRKMFYPYANHLYNGPEGIEMVEALVEANSAIAWKRYLKTQADERSARAFLEDELAARARAYRKAVPEALEHIAVCFGYFSAPNEFLNTNPAVNYKKYLDMQLNLVANDPAFWGTYGLMSYLAGYADEETVRWMAHLFRHYGIRGQRSPASRDPHDVTYMVNGDFANGTKGWTIEPAEQGSVRTDTWKGFGWLQGRYPRTPEGDTVLVMKRSDKRPNTFTQEIKGLVPGRLYSFRMFAADFDDMSKEAVHAVTVKLDGVKLIDKKCFTHLGHNCYSHHREPFDREHKAWFNYHWRVFRAEAKTARVTVTDWLTPDKPGGKIGQQLMYNFAHVQPYFPEGNE